MEKFKQLSLFLLLVLGLAACKGSKDSKGSTDQAQSNASSQIEKLIFHSGTCFGPCPSYCISVERSGKVEFWGGLFSRLSGYYEGQVTGADLETAVQLMDHMGWDTLQSNYQANWTDASTYSTVLVKNGRMYKSIRDYGGIAKGPAPDAYAYFKRLYDFLELQPLVPTALTCWAFQQGQFEDQGKRKKLMLSEMFFLWQEWRNNGRLTGSFVYPFKEGKEPHYAHATGAFGNKKVPRLPNCVQNSPKPVTLSNEGTTFVIRYDSGDQVQIDLGYNFFKENVFVY